MDQSKVDSCLNSPEGSPFRNALKKKKHQKLRKKLMEIPSSAEPVELRRGNMREKNVKIPSAFGSLPPSRRFLRKQEPRQLSRHASL